MYSISLRRLGVSCLFPPPVQAAGSQSGRNASPFVQRLMNISTAVLWVLLLPDEMRYGCWRSLYLVLFNNVQTIWFNAVLIERNGL